MLLIHYLDLSLKFSNMHMSFLQGHAELVVGTAPTGFLWDCSVLVAPSLNRGDLESRIRSKC